MFKILINKKEIDNCQNTFIKAIKNQSKIYRNFQVGYKGGDLRNNVYWQNKFQYWLSCDRLPNRYWNAFGKDNPREKSHLSIICEINFPYEGNNKTIAAKFARNESGNTVILHSGKIGGGREGIGKELFWDNYRGAKVIAIEPTGKMVEMALIADIDSKNMPAQINFFIDEVQRIKGLSPKMHGGIIKSDAFKSEYSGKRNYSIYRDISAKCNHGIIVEELFRFMRTHKYFCKNNRHIDLLAHDKKNSSKIIFEVKTSNSITDIYSAVGQLYLNSINILPNPKLIIVVPCGINRQIVNHLKKLRISVLQYDYKKRVDFINIDNILG